MAALRPLPTGSWFFTGRWISVEKEDPDNPGTLGLDCIWGRVMEDPSRQNNRYLGIYRGHMGQIRRVPDEPTP